MEKKKVCFPKNQREIDDVIIPLWENAERNSKENFYRMVSLKFFSSIKDVYNRNCIVHNHLLFYYK